MREIIFCGEKIIICVVYFTCLRGEQDSEFGVQIFMKLFVAELRGLERHRVSEHPSSLQPISSRMKASKENH